MLKLEMRERERETENFYTAICSYGRVKVFLPLLGTLPGLSYLFGAPLALKASPLFFSSLISLFVPFLFYAIIFLLFILHSHKNLFLSYQYSLTKNI